MGCVLTGSSGLGRPPLPGPQSQCEELVGCGHEALRSTRPGGPWGAEARGPTAPEEQVAGAHASFCSSLAGEVGKEALVQG